MDIVKIEDKSYNVLVTGIEENFNILYEENTGRTVANGGRMFLFPLGTFYSHRVTFKRRKGFEVEYDELFNQLSIPRSEGIAVEIIHGQQLMRYEAYVSNGTRKVKRIENGVVKWDEMNVNFIPMEAQVIPDWGVSDNE